MALFSWATSASLDNGNPVQSGIELLMSCEGTVGMDEIVEDGIDVGDIFPNPVLSEINIDLELLDDSEVIAVIYDVTGRKTEERIFPLFIGDNRLKISVNQLPKGVYVLSLHFPENDARFLKKFIK
jgi:hypothetical protein